MRYADFLILRPNLCRTREALSGPRGILIPEPTVRIAYISAVPHRFSPGFASLLVAPSLKRVKTCRKSKLFVTLEIREMRRLLRPALLRKHPSGVAAETHGCGAFFFVW
jgi:hypothetical protein